ncbi:hypothetical protein B6N13_03595 [Marinomonas sp. UCMA 3892]|uniref:pentapeptide repeat-containing protein n=1 Tax=unclassified Marinomonas TaxID=196814 RepID=UPI00146D88D1|nr:pentapeptide repeat-containing protein [Marinomonas sp. UCMA 3892]NLU97181.1 hypothetical protein [Marinomonas sp. UCMA 3892]
MSDNNPFPNSEYKGFIFSKSDMSGTQFDCVNLSDSKFWVELKNAKFSDSNLEACAFDDVNLSHSTYENINLSCSKFNNVNMSNTSFTNLNLENTEISNANLLGMKINGVLVSDLFEAYERKNIG